MEESVVVVMLRNEETGFLEKELFLSNIHENAEFLERLYVTRGDDGFYAHAFLCVGCDVEDWQFDALYDYYDDEAWDSAFEFREVCDNYNPMWRVSFKCEESGAGFDETLKDILARHGEELASAFVAISAKKEEYM
ncbi:MAG: hypothetical protein LBL35_08160 [Clostridiales bacterium]|jgi:hypothetical protein|nr:hypothetical protein [Clostridiales bacterium]